VDAVVSLSLAPRERIHWVPLPTYTAFLERGQLATETTTDIAFVGNLYLGTLEQNGFWRDDFFRQLTTQICHRKTCSLHLSMWEILTQEIEHLSSDVRRRRGLYPDKRTFWDYYIFAVWFAANALVRVDVLSQIKHDVSLFGLFSDPASIELLHQYPNLRYMGEAHHSRELPTVYASTRVNICISNGVIYKGVPSKLIDCLASGGFALVDPKDDLIRLLGSTVEEIFFRNAEELNDKIEFYLTRPKRRREIANELRDKVVQACTLEAFFEKALSLI
jgi:spore maturation protein CgeB